MITKIKTLIVCIGFLAVADVFAADVISLNFGAGDGRNASDGDGLVPANGWHNLSASSNNRTDLKSQNSVDPNIGSVAWRCANNYQWDGADEEIPASILKGYLDDGESEGKRAEITVSGIPFACYDVIVYVATDTENYGFKPVYINGGYFIGSATEGDYGYCEKVLVNNGDSSKWGASRGLVAEYGKNALRVNKLSGDLVIKGGSNSDSLGARGCIAAVQIVESGYEALGSKYQLVFRGHEDGDWSELANWFVYALNPEEDGGNFKWVSFAGGVPGVPGGSFWGSTLVDGKFFKEDFAVEDGYKVVSAGTLEGWNSNIGVANGVHLKISHLNKMQNPDNVANVWSVDETSKITVSEYGKGNKSGVHHIECFAPTGIVFSSDCDVSFSYVLGKSGSVAYDGALSGTHTFANVVLDLGDKTKSGIELRTRELIAFESSSAVVEYADGWLSAVTSDETSVEMRESAAMNEVGMYSLEKKDNGYYINYVAYGDTSVEGTQRVETEGDVLLSKLGLTSSEASIAEIVLAPGATLTIDEELSFSALTIVSSGDVFVEGDPAKFAGIKIIDFHGVAGDAMLVVHSKINEFFPTIASKIAGDYIRAYHLKSDTSGCQVVEAVLEVPDDVVYKFSGDFDFSGANTIAANGTLEIVSGLVNFNLATTGFSGMIKVLEGATLKNGTNDGPNYNGAPRLDIAGTLEIAGTARWSLPARSETVLREDACLKGSGGSGYNYAFDYFGGATIRVVGDATIEGNIGAHNGGELVFDIESEKKLEIVGNVDGTVYGNSPGASLRAQGGGTLVLRGSDTYTGQTTIEDGTTIVISSESALASAPIVNNGILRIACNVNYAGASITGDGVIEVADGVEFGIGSCRTSLRFDLGEGAKIALQLESDGEAVEFKASELKQENLIIRDAQGNVVEDFTLTQNNEGVFVVKMGLPTWSNRSGDGSFSDISNWSTGSKPEGGKIVVELDGEIQIELDGDYQFSSLALRGTGSLVFVGDYSIEIESVAVPEGCELVDNANVSSANICVLRDGLLVIDAGEESVEIATVISGEGRVATKGNVKLTAQNTFTGGLVVKTGTLSAGNNHSYGGSGVTAHNAVVIVEDGACVDLANTKDYNYAFEIAGKGVRTELQDGTVSYSGAMKNSGDSIGSGSRQAYKIKLNGDALIITDNSWGLVNNAHSETTLDLGGYTLTKAGSGSFFIDNTTATSGKFVVIDGTLEFCGSQSSSFNCELTMAGSVSANVGVSVSGITKLTFKPATFDGIPLTGNSSIMLSTSGKVILDSNGVDMLNHSYGDEITIVKDCATAISNGLFGAVDVIDVIGGRFGDVVVGETSVTAKVKNPEPFIHYNFDSGSLSADGSAAEGSVKFSSWRDINGNGATASVQSKNGRASRIYYASDNDRAVPYWDGNTAGKSPISTGVMTVTSVIKPMDASKKFVIWALGAVYDSPNTGVALAIENENTFSVIKFTGTTPEVLVTVSGVEKLVGAYHFVAVRFDEYGTSLTVDGKTSSTTSVAPLNYGQQGQLGSTHGANPTGYSKQGSQGVYFDDFAIYDTLLTSQEMRAMWRKMCPQAFAIRIR